MLCACLCISTGECSLLSIVLVTLWMRDVLHFTAVVVAAVVLARFIGAVVDVVSLAIAMVLGIIKFCCDWSACG